MRSLIRSVELNLLNQYQTDYLSSPEANFETILSLVSSFFVPEDEDAFIDWVRVTLGTPEIRSAMKGWRQSWEQLVAQGRQHDALL